jgi:glycosyltransferase involved in cell wall biosynthesis
VAALAAAVRSIVETPELAEMLRRRGIERAAGFTWQRTIDGFAQAYSMVEEGIDAHPRDTRSPSCAA